MWLQCYNQIMVPPGSAVNLIENPSGDRHDKNKGHADVGVVQIIKYNKHWRLSERLQKCPNRDLQHMTTTKRRRHVAIICEILTINAGQLRVGVPAATATTNHAQNNGPHF